MPAYECQTCAHRHLMPHQYPCAMCSRRYSLRWEPVRATLIGIIQPPRGLL
jgi:DNA-directed RNA polymerase subunit RPC12/RpoP